MTEINRSLCAILRRTREPFLATAFYAVADVAAGELRFANSGHPSPFRLRRDAGGVESLIRCDPRHGPAPGLFEKAAYPTSVCPLNVGDLILLYTDGIYEAMNREGVEFGRERFTEAIRRRVTLPAQELFDGLLEDARDFSGTREFEDDVCLVGVEICRLGIHP